MVYLFFQTWIWLLLAATLGLLVGWLIWKNEEPGDSSSLQEQLDECKRRCMELESAARVSDKSSVAGTVEPDNPVGSVDGMEPEFLDKPVGEADDLKRISGIGPVLEKTLNTLGIFHFRQIAAFTPDNIEWVNNYLSFSGRIEREKWVAQAEVLAKQKPPVSPVQSEGSTTEDE